MVLEFPKEVIVQLSYYDRLNNALFFKRIPVFSETYVVSHNLLNLSPSLTWSQ